MTDANQEVLPPENEGNGGGNEDSLRTVTGVIYVLYVAAFINGLTALIGVIIAHVKANDARGTWLESHFTWLIRTFWLAFVGGVIGFILVFVAIGWLVLAAVTVWFIYRIVKGGLRYMDRKPIEDPQGWF